MWSVIMKNNLQDEKNLLGDAEAQTTLSVMRMHSLLGAYYIYCTFSHRALNIYFISYKF